MNREDFQKIKSCINQALDVFRIKLESGEPTEEQLTRRRMPYRLRLFVQEYEGIIGRPYSIRDYPEEGGAATRSELIISNDLLYSQAILAYLQNTDPKIIQAQSFMYFISNINKWISQAIRKNKDVKKAK